MGPSFPIYIPGGAATCSEGFEKCFLSVPRMLGCTTAAMMPKQASKGNFRKHVTKPSEQVATPPSTYQGGSVRLKKHKKIQPLKNSKYFRDSGNSPLSGMSLRYDLEAPRIVTTRQVLIRVTSVAVDDAGETAKVKGVLQRREKVEKVGKVWIHLHGDELSAAPSWLGGWIRSGFRSTFCQNHTSHAV